MAGRSPIYREAERVDWGLQMQIHEPFGNRLRFCEQIDEQP